MKIFTITMIAALGLALGCSSQNPDKTREEAAKIASEAKQQSKQASKEIEKGAEQAREQGKAAVQGAREGWNADGSKVDLNHASKDDLASLPGVDVTTADNIIANRPYHSKDELKTKGLVPPDEYDRIEARLIVK